MATTRTARTEWRGALADGSGSVSLVSSGTGDFPVTWASRSEEPNGRTSPEELIAAAHSSCFSMQLSGLLTSAGTPPERLDTSAEVGFGPSGDGFAITGITLRVRASVPGADESGFQRTAQQAKEICPVSGALKGVEIDLDAALQ
ncbi:OsmC family protein [Salinifilum aidingensis]